MGPTSIKRINIVPLNIPLEAPFKIAIGIKNSIQNVLVTIQLENGAVYELRGTAGLTSIIFSIGLLGTINVILLFTFLIGICVFLLLKKINQGQKLKN